MELLKLASGHLVLFTTTASRAHPTGGGAFRGRRQDLARQNALQAQFYAYRAFRMQADHLIYTSDGRKRINHAVFTEADLRAR